MAEEEVKMLVAVVGWDRVLATCKGESSCARKKKIMVCCVVEEVEKLASMVEDYMAVTAARPWRRVRARRWGAAELVVDTRGGCRAEKEVGIS